MSLSIRTLKTGQLASPKMSDLKKRRERPGQKSQCLLLLNLGSVIGSLLPYYIDQPWCPVGEELYGHVTTKQWGPLGVISESGYQRHCELCWSSQAWVGADHLTSLKLWSPLVVLPVQLPFGIIWGPCFYCRLPLILQRLPATVMATMLWHLAPSCSPCVCDPSPCSEPQRRRTEFIHGWMYSGNSLMTQDSH